MQATVTEKGEVTLPKPIRDRLASDAGARSAFETQPDDTLIVRVSTGGSSGLAGPLARPGEAAIEPPAIGAAVTARRIAKRA